MARNALDITLPTRRKDTKRARLSERAEAEVEEHPWLIPVRSIRFTHNRISNHFGYPETRTFQELVSALNEGLVVSHTAEFLRLELFAWKGQYFSINNRRTYCLWKHQEENPTLDVRIRPWKVHQPLSDGHVPRYESKVNSLFWRMFSTTSGGCEVLIGGQPGQIYRLPLKPLLLPRPPSSIPEHKEMEDEDEDIVKKELGLEEDARCLGLVNLPQSGSVAADDAASACDFEEFRQSVPGICLRDVLMEKLPKQASGPSVWFICPRTPYGTSLANKVELFWRRHCGKAAAKRLLPALTENAIERQTVRQVKAIVASSTAALKYVRELQGMQLRTVLLVPCKEDAEHQLKLVQHISAAAELVLLPRQALEPDRQMVTKLQAAAGPALAVTVHWATPEGLEQYTMPLHDRCRWRLVA